MDRNITIIWNWSTVAWIYGTIHTIGAIAFYYYCLYEEKKEAKENETPIDRYELGKCAIGILLFTPVMIMLGIVIVLNQTVGRLGRLICFAEWGSWVDVKWGWYIEDIIKSEN